MAQLFVRVWKNFEIEEVKKHLLFMGDSSGDCANCRAFGLDPWSAKSCPECKTTFQFFTSRRFQTHPGERFSFAKRAHDKRPELICIDYEDYMKAIGDKKARDFFS
ncbi:MAG: hypothetical protein COV74_01645 [Candidatus Omnitrophica bacterium CG11_big_fil_rev_8_21_14_0_20_45_26]|uniref:Uncharacterized protein n=1 Tax=Candidatus Abzuiibacterium crystallinum TaxID=1974748 RepID=A0A2H0LS43_9BACT|nr:MAG: hypothetical protein COV74_01645 [Candidatus Omnitrophica bacterium CG11_big_fil_rev_8_21_14_0_20_45_26]PIW64999.1 MAG: hypothetical protein COW12_03925 [Candidatus Omnitrophica bacterium CG12_big_fil_rev_8_21_14_0_65_45_16]